MASDSTRKLEAKCHCGSVHFTLTIATSHLPLPVHLCHCSLCRYQTGAACIFHFDSPEDGVLEFVAPSSAASLTRYPQPGGRSTYDFCSTCGCHIRATAPAPEGDKYTLSPSIFTEWDDAVFQIRRHIYSHSAKDGGLAGCLSSRVGGRQLLDWNPDEGQPDARVVESMPEHHDDGRERLRAQCYCGGVSFTFTRPTDDMARDEKCFAKYISPVDPAKWRATWDVCGDCRLVNGTHVVGWAYVPRVLCDPPFGRDLRIGTSKTYESSPGVLRSFCDRCGATVFFTRAERTPSDEKQIVNVASGILRAPEGTMADNWLTWKSSLSHSDPGNRFDAGFVDALAVGMRSWSASKYGKELDFPIARTLEPE